MLTDAAIKAAKPLENKTVKLSDGEGLQLWIKPTGAKLWNFAYRFDGKQKKLSFGIYPALGLKEAREKRTEAKKVLASGLDPSQQKRIEKANKIEANGNTFKILVDELLAKKAREGKAETTLGKLLWILDFPMPLLGARAISEITSAEILIVLRQIEARGRLETSRRLRSVIGEVFRYAIATSRAVNDPTFALRGALTTPKVQHRPAIVEPVALGGLMRAVDDYQGAPEVSMALQLLALLFTRPGELRLARWSEFDLEAGLWMIPAERMKMRRPHRVPLAPQAVGILKELHALTGHRELLFPGVRSHLRPMSENTMNAALRRLGYSKDEMTGHGFRAAASSLLNESGLWNADAIEAQLAHVEGNSIRKAYARAEYWDERVKMMAWWATRLDEMRQGGKVIPLRA